MLEQLDTSIATTIEAIEAQWTRTPPPKVTAVWGEEVDWRLFLTHIFWDAWIHERDLLLPLGREPGVLDAETRLAAAYGLHTAAIMVGLLGIPLDATRARPGRRLPSGPGPCASDTRSLTTASAARDP